MTRRRRAELTAIASLDDEIARARQRCDDHVQQAYEKLVSQLDEETPVHDRYLSCLRPFYETAVVAADRVDASVWPTATLQAFLGQYFVAYRDVEAYASLCEALEAEGAQWNGSGSSRQVLITSFDMLKAALQHDTATRMAEQDDAALEKPFESYQLKYPVHDHGREDDELALPRLAIHGKRPRPGPTAASPPVTRNGSIVSMSRSSISAVRVSQSDVSSVWCEDEDDDQEYSVPTTSEVLPTEFSAEVVKKSQNWFGRWRTRHMLLRWNELEMRKKSGGTSSRHGVARSFPSQPAMSTAATAHATIPVSAGAPALSASVKSKRYALQNLISIQLIQLNESDPSRKHAIDIHFKQTAVNGHGHTTKSLILGSDKGIESLKKIMSFIATFALFRGLVAGEKAQQLQRYIQSGANVNAFSAVPSQRFPVPMSPLQLALVHWRAKSDKQSELAIMRMLQDAKADMRVLLHWHFARRTLLSTDERSDSSVVELLLPITEPIPSSIQMPLTLFGSDEHGWTLLMYLSLLGDADRVLLLLNRICSSIQEKEKLHRYLEHVNGSGDTALHIAIKASGCQQGESGDGENTALAIASWCLGEGTVASSSSNVFFISDANGQTVLHLAIKAKMWRLVEFFLKHQLFDSCTRDDFGNNALHLMIKIGAPLDVFEMMVQYFMPKARRRSAADDLDSPDQANNMSPVLLAVRRRREDFVQILLEAEAVVTSPDQLHSDVSCLKAGDRETVLHVAIRMGLASTARSIMHHVRRRGGAVQPSTLSLAIRFGMYRLAHVILRELTQNPSLAEQKSSWIDAETGYHVATMAILAGQLELAAVIVDVGGSGVWALHDTPLREALLHALVVSGIRQPQPASKSRRDQMKPRHSKSKSEGDLLSKHRPPTDPSKSWTGELMCNVFRECVIEELVTHSLLTLSNVDELTTSIRQTVAKTFRIGDQARIDGAHLELDQDSSLLGMIAGASNSLSSRLLALVLAAVRMKHINSDPCSAVVDMITASCGYQGGTAVFVALSEGRMYNALLLLHHLLPTVPDRDRDQVGEGDGRLWMESADTTLLHLACERPNDPDALVIIDLLLRSGAYSGSWDVNGWCPLHVAVQSRCDVRAIQLFNKHDQDLNVWSDAVNPLQMHQGEVAVPLTPLMVAGLNNNLAAFRELVRCGADVRVVIPTYRLGLLHFAARCENVDRELIEEMLKFPAIQESTRKDVYGLSGFEAAAMLRCRQTQESAPISISNDSRPLQIKSSAFTQDDRRELEVGGEINVLRITLLGLQTSELGPTCDSNVLPPPPITSSEDMTRSPHASPPRSPTRSLVKSDSARSRRSFPSPDRRPREPSAERARTPQLSRHPVLEDTTLEFLQDEEKATLTLIAQEARTEAQEWLKKRSGYKKLLSEARAQLQTTHSHRRTGSGTIVTIVEAVPPVTDAQLLDTYMNHAAKQFVDKHVALAVADARMAIEREKRVIFQETGVFPGELMFSNKAKDSSIGSTSVVSTKEGSGMHRSASINGSMMLLSSRSNDLSDPENDSGRGGVAWWSDEGTGSLDNSGTFVGEPNTLNGTWLLSEVGGAVGRGDDGDEVVQNPLDCEAFVRMIEKRNSLH